MAIKRRIIITLSYAQSKEPFKYIKNKLVKILKKYVLTSKDRLPVGKRFASDLSRFIPSEQPTFGRKTRWGSSGKEKTPSVGMELFIGDTKFRMQADDRRLP